MSAIISMTENSNAVGTADHCDELRKLVEDIWKLAPECLPLHNPHSVSHLINPAYSNSPSTLALVVRYLRYKVYYPLFYLALMKHCVDDDDRNTTAMMPWELGDGSPFGNMSAAVKEISNKEKILLMKELWERKSELKVELTSIEKWRRLWSKVDMALSIVLVVINSGALVAPKVMPASVTPMLLASLAAGNLLITTALKVVDKWLGVTDDKLKSQLQSQKDGINVMCGELLRHDLEPIVSLLKNLKKRCVDLRAVEIERSSTAPTEEAGQTLATDHLEREVKVKKMKKKVEKRMEDVHEMVERVEQKVKKAASNMVNIINK